MANKLKICAIVQARMGSERLPGKVLKLICGKPVLARIIERSGASKMLNEVVLAIPDTKGNDVLEKFAKEKSVKYYRGSEDKVLERFYLAAKENNCDVILRWPADDLLIDPEIIDIAVKNHLATGADYSCTEYPEWFLPRGLGTEVMNFAALQNIFNNVEKIHEKEDVTFHFLKNPAAFKFNSVKLSDDLRRPELRLTLDTEEDLELITKIYEELYKEGELFKTEEILNLISKRPELKEINSHIVQRI